jgi:gluconokinase
MLMERSVPRFDKNHVILMGVSGCGKSTIGAELSCLSRIPYSDGDDLHPSANVEKMRSGLPLDDADRLPWLEECGRSVAQARSGLILGCSSLKLSYRDTLRKNAFPVQPIFVYLEGNREALLQRLQKREGHYMPASLLDSQLAALEPPEPFEGAIIVGIERPAKDLAERIFNLLGWRAQCVAQRSQS